MNNVHELFNFHHNHVISPRQHGFVKGLSTNLKFLTSNLLTYVHYLNMAFNKSCQVDSLYTDFAKAFHKVDHENLCRKAHHLGIHGTILRWLASYLKNRTQLVAVYGYSSVPFEPTSRDSSGL